MNTKKAFWITYDLGLKGDYSGFYTFLDTVNAKECGDSVAFFQKEYKSDLIDEVKKDIQSFANISKNDRVYLMHKDLETGKIKGNFLFGGRKRAPWEGYALGLNSAEEDVA